MMHLDEDALICDMAETYHVTDYRELPAQRSAILAAGLHEDARIKQKMADIGYTWEQMMTAAIFDNTRWLCWAQSEDGRKGRNRPESMAARLIEGNTGRVQGFHSGEAMRNAWEDIVRRAGNGNSGNSICTDSTLHGGDRQ